MEMPIINLRLTSVSPSVGKRFIWKTHAWLDKRVMLLPYIRHLVGGSLEEIYEHAHVKKANFDKIHEEFKTYGLHFEMSDIEIREYYNQSLMGRPFGSTYVGPGTMDYLTMLYSLDDDIVKAMAIYQERYKDKKRRISDIVFWQYSMDMELAGINDIHEFAAKVIKENDKP